MATGVCRTLNTESSLLEPMFLGFSFKKIHKYKIKSIFVGVVIYHRH